MFGEPVSQIEVTLLGIAQDGGYPQPGCHRQCCRPARRNPALTGHPVALGISDPEGLNLVEVTRALEVQLAMLDPDAAQHLAGVWVTHGHLGHTDGLGLLGREAMAVDRLPLHCSPDFAGLVERTPAWQRLVDWKHLALTRWKAQEPNPGGPGWTVTPLPVPHRDELADTHALLLEGPEERLLFLPDHDSWEATLAAHAASDPRAWFTALGADIVLLDGTFWSLDELPDRAQIEVPHPPVKQTLELLGPRREDDPRVVFIHLNHTNPLLQPESGASRHVRELGWEVGVEGMRWRL